MTDTQATTRTKTRSRMTALHDLCKQERAALEIVGHAHTPAEKAGLEFLTDALSALDAASAASTFAERLDDALNRVSDRLDGPLGGLIRGWHAPSDDEDAAEIAGHSEVRSRQALKDLSALSAAVAPVKLPQV